MIRWLLLALLCLLSPASVAQSPGPVAPELVAGCTVMTTPGTFTDGTREALTCDTGGLLKVTATAAVSGTVTANQGTANATPWNMNVAQINGVTPLMGNGATGTGSHRVTIASDNSPVAGVGAAATGGAAPANAVYGGANVGGNLTGNIGCGSSIVYDASTNGITQLVAASGTTSVYVCGYTVFSAGTVNVNLKSGDTGGSCANSVAMTPAFQFIAQTGVADGSPVFRGLKTPSGKALCLNTSAGIAVQAIVYYTQF